ncbi:unnamed protein product, partial [Phaeothamnion confervicola]
SIIVYSPDTSTVVWTGGEQGIYWYCYGLSLDVDLDLLHKNGSVAEAIATSTPCAEEHWTWSVPAELPPASSYSIRVKPLSGDEVAASSPPFTVANVASVTFKSPAAGARIMVGSTLELT